MGLLVPEPTAYDVHFRLFGFPVRVSVWFWVVQGGLAFGCGGIGEGALPLVWVGCVFVSVLVHELGHVATGRYFGADGEIILNGIGGAALGSTDLYHRWKRVVVLLAGPLAQLPLAGLAALGVWLTLGGDPFSGHQYPLLRMTLLVLFLINLAWPLFNLLPIPPLDGGQIAREVIGAFHSSEPPWARDPDWWKRG